MALSLCKLAALLLVTATGIKAAPAPDIPATTTADSALDFPATTTSALTPEPSPFVRNGDFSGKLPKTWTFTKVCSNPEACPLTDGIHRIGKHGEYAAQITSIRPECTIGNVVYSVLTGTIKNLVAGEDYKLSFDYRFEEAIIYSLWQNIQVSNAVTSNPMYIQNAKAQKYYTFSIQVHAQKSGAQTLALDYFHCPYQGTPPPTVQLDNFEIVPLE